MSLIELILTGLALSADAMSVSISNIFAAPDMSRTKKLSMPLAFGVFQGLMPLLGYFLSGFAASFIERYAGIISFLILGFIGGKMIYDFFKGGDEDDAPKDGVSYKMILVQAVATSIDAFAVGVAFAADAVNIWLAAGIIAICTFLCCLCMLFVGRKLGPSLGDKATLIGGIILVLIGLKALLF